ARELLTAATGAAVRDGRALAEAPGLAGRVTCAQLDRWCDPAAHVAAAPALVDRSLEPRASRRSAAPHAPAPRSHLCEPAERSDGDICG
ncbi:hypothetical protein AB0I84_43310, partial [Streptomyces spectabilis]